MVSGRQVMREFPQPNPVSARLLGGTKFRHAQNSLLIFKMPLYCRKIHKRHIRGVISSRTCVFWAKIPDDATRLFTPQRTEDQILYVRTLMLLVRCCSLVELAALSLYSAIIDQREPSRVPISFPSGPSVTGSSLPLLPLQTPDQRRLISPIAI